MTTYTLTISGGLAKYMPEYNHEHASIEAAKEEYRRVLSLLPDTTQGAHIGEILGSDGSVTGVAS